MNTILKLIADWIKNNPNKEEIKTVLARVLEYAQTVLASIDDIISGQSVVPSIGVNLPGWAITLELGLKGIASLDANLIPAALKDLIEYLTNELTEVTTELSNQLPLTPADQQTAPHASLITIAKNVATAANNIQAAAPTVASTAQAIMKDIALIPQLIEQIIAAAKKAL